MQRVAQPTVVVVFPPRPGWGVMAVTSTSLPSGLSARRFITPGAHLRFIIAVQVDVLPRQAKARGDLFNGPGLHALRDFDIGQRLFVRIRFVQDPSSPFFCQTVGFFCSGASFRFPNTDFRLAINSSTVMVTAKVSATGSAMKTPIRPEAGK